MPLNLEQKGKLFDYLVVRLAQWFIEENQLQSFEDFNRLNDFSKNKLSLFPFFICTANGDRKILFENFNYFIPDPIGLIEKEIKDHLALENRKYKSNSFKTQFILQEGFILPTTSTSPTHAILKVLEIDPDNQIEDTSLRLRDIIQGIDNSIDSIRFKRNIPFFVNISEENLSKHSKEHNSWALFSNSESLLDLYGGKIPSDFLIKEKSIFASAVDARVVA